MVRMQMRQDNGIERYVFRFSLFSGFVVACLVQPLMINDEVEDANIEALLTGDAQAMKFRRLLYSSPKVQANLQKLIPMYDEMGLFE